ncbi:hypothetical protein [Ignatzschineria cameli]|uniref:hypothetical protein n=1 Tax=Ignatzschineria cameli TaxID=2182793 RepID=UPI001300B3EA|nr:hypothetical protein [Ignatzschineria cameli]
MIKKKLNAVGSYYPVLPKISCRQMAIFLLPVLTIACFSKSRAGKYRYFNNLIPGYH